VTDQQTATERLRDRAFDVAGILLSFLCALILAGEAESIGRISENETFFAVIIGLAGSLSLWWRRRHPLAVAIFLLPLSALTDATAYAGVAVLYTLIVQRRTRAVIAVVLLSVVAGTLYSVRRPDPDLHPVAEVLVTSMLLAIAAAVAIAVRARRDLVESLRQRAEQSEEQARLRADRLRALERERIAREMHDAIAHRISLVSLHAGALQLRRDLTADEMAEAAATIRDSAHAALEDLRAILGVLRAGDGDSGLRPQPDLSHLGDLLAEAETAGVRVEAVNRLGEAAAVTPALGRTVYRLVQEGLTNARKHAPGSTVRVLLDRTAEGELHVHLSNPLGGGSSGVPGSHAGLLGLTERVELVGGRLRHGVRAAAPGSGPTFDLEAWIPWPTTT
jgi:signal transduction histidine kinase